ncbi:hypothetical protein PhCBS80983_g00922 [Powellomyces hirtus]|uniref:Pre-rRNA-processing protein PNO1 n=1 Tax=Powellomyces hirtus TaxID=109895 RepID=A0A507ECV1_9FUNG|nr:hypothetical protein PhCBS80983_g00922 [Powellomyces hirtus]
MARADKKQSDASAGDGARTMAATAAAALESTNAIPNATPKRKRRQRARVTTTTTTHAMEMDTDGGSGAGGGAGTVDGGERGRAAGDAGPDALPRAASRKPRRKHKAKTTGGGGAESGGEGVDMEVVPAGDAMAVDGAAAERTSTKPRFGKVKPGELMTSKLSFRRIPVPPHRLTPLQKDWLKLYSPLVEHMKLQVRVNLKAKAVEMRTCPQTEDAGALQKGADFVKAYCLGFEIEDAIALLRLDDLFIDTFEIKDVKTLAGDNLSRAVGRIVGKDGKTKFAIENTSRTRVVIADTKIHILGSFANIRVARDAVVALILGSTPGKVYSHLRTVSARMKERF